MLYILIGVLIFVSASLAWLVFDMKRKMDGGEKGEKIVAVFEQLKMLTNQNDNLRRDIDSKLSETHRATNEQISRTIQTVQGITGQSAKQIADVVSGLTKLEETNKQVINFSAQLQNLQDILKNPKQRGVLGEYYLKEILENVLPPNAFQMQYGFGNGDIVDAVVFVKKKIIPIDSKFSLENYERIINCKGKEERDKYEKAFKQDLKNRIDETSKYIKPEEGTMDFAFMFIPSEAIYYDLLINKVGAVQVNTTDLIKYATRDKKVIIVSPTSFHAYLQTVLQGLRALQIEESAKQIRNNVEKLGKHIVSYEEYMKKLGNSMGTSIGHFNAAYKELGKIDKDVIKVTEGKKSIEPIALEKPNFDI
ncbi:MAG TPA: DNA recombination protein RmuC [Candidatus Moranbacteria bacterium]|nr:DNA recombination protein RmuC [Candidatus Moranbacteria bacterium]